MTQAADFPPYKRAHTKDLIPYARNARTHSEAQVAQIAASIREFGFTNPILVDGDNGIIAGHGRVLAAQKLGMAQVPVIELAHLTDVQRKAYILADNKLALNAGWDEELLALELDDLREADFDLSLIGFEDAEAEGGEGEGGGAGGAGSLADRFLIPPFSVLNAREGWWQDRKRAWLALGIRSEEGRGDHTGMGAPGGSLMPAMKQVGHVQGAPLARGDSYGRPIAKEKAGMAQTSTGTSIFDPVLCEIAYRWFCPPGGTVLDPFAGGSVRGIVAARLGRQYVGNDLRSEQVAANRLQADEIVETDDPMPVWTCGDSRNIAKLCAGTEADFVFMCPPYADLEVYSDDPADLSTLGYDEFIAAYREIITASCGMLKNDRFACCVVGDVRDKRGNYYNFVSDTIGAFRAAGLALYNEAILITMVGSLPIRAGKQFSASRKLGKTHQNVLVFVKGDGKRATAACGEIDVAMPEGMEEGQE